MNWNIRPLYPLVVLLIIFAMIASDQNRDKVTMGNDTASMRKDASTIADTTIVIDHQLRSPRK
ncbi:hypothetical protein FO440_23540 [Mucilaginibacter corticis]|uniref:Uncharacterized protein n=1 Tax=Mucilaginibacter corticis TaxID=2597670 RepID=A0A556M7Y3_9SPHI|nr:hypothetical protein [Mucilaginibacter corticis]TSJ35896.1 hypothetical protein FO440_23540 [Mucilaginibacter corticis]